jgi:hypothetical protein
MTGTFRIRRSRGALSGALLALLGLWGAVIPLVGPYFHFAYAPDAAWHFTPGRFWLEQLPGLVVLAGGVIVLWSGHRLVGLLGAWMAAAGGAWFAVGTLVSHHWPQVPSAGAATGGSVRVFLEQVGLFTGLGVVIVLLAGVAMGRLSLVSVGDVKKRDRKNRDRGTTTTVEKPARPRRILDTPLVRRVIGTPEQAPDAERVDA